MANAWNCILGTPIYSDAFGPTYSPVLSAGSWLAALPLANLQARELIKVARSTDALAASTKFDCDLGVARAVRVLALVEHNFSSAATVRFRGYSDAGYTTLVYDSGTFNAWPAGMTAENYDGYVKTAMHVATADQTARYWRTEITDTGNPAGYVQVGRVVIAGGYQATINMQYGARLGWETETQRKVTDGGAAIYDRRRGRRHVTFTLGELLEDEALANLFELQRREGLHGQLLFVYDPEDTTHAHRRRFLAVQRELSPLERASFGRDTMPVALVEEL